jgi:hypothetical protein
MLRVGFEPTIPAFERAKTVHVLDRAAAVIGNESFCLPLVNMNIHRTARPTDDVRRYTVRSVIEETWQQRRTDTEYLTDCSCNCR